MSCFLLPFELYCDVYHTLKKDLDFKQWHAIELADRNVEIKEYECPCLASYVYEWYVANVHAFHERYYHKEECSILNVDTLYPLKNFNGGKYLSLIELYRALNMIEYQCVDFTFWEGSLPATRLSKVMRQIERSWITSSTDYDQANPLKQ